MLAGAVTSLSWSSTLDREGPCLSLPLASQKWGFLRSTVFIMMGLFPPAKYWESPALCKALPGTELLRQLCSPPGGPGVGVVGISG